MGLKAISASSRNQSYWMLQDAGENLFRMAKERVYRLIRVENEQKKPVWRLKRVLEHKPKEKLLSEVLTEIEKRWNDKFCKNRNDNKDELSASVANSNVLLMVKDERTLRSVRSYLAHGLGENRAAAQNFLNYLDQVQQRMKPLIRTGALDLNSMPTEQRLLFEEHSRVHNILFGADKMDRFSKVVEEDRLKLTHWKKRRKKMAEEKARGSITADAIRQQACLDEAVEQSRGNGKTSSTMAVFQRADSGEESSDDGSLWWSSDDEDGLVYKVEPIDGLKVFIRTFSSLAEGEAAIMLHDIQPSYVVMHDSDPSFIRTLEIFSNSMYNSAPCNSTKVPEEERLQVFFLLYEASAEDINFLSSLDREKKAFDTLIEHKKRMPTSMSSMNDFSSTQEMQQACGGCGGSYGSGRLPLSMDTRTGGGNQKVLKERRDIAVDVRLVCTCYQRQCTSFVKSNNRTSYIMSVILYIP
jgi:DNA excision repair protein ERCC-4